MESKTDARNVLFLVKERSSDDDNPELKSLFPSDSSEHAVQTNVKIFVHSETLAKKIYHGGIPSELKGLTLWSAKNFANPENVMIDVGSHLGLYSMAFSAAGAGAVYSFECNPTVYTALVNNTMFRTFGDSIGSKDQNVVKTFPFALGNRNECNVGFYNRTQDGNENGFHMYSHEKKFIMFHPDKPKDVKLKLDMVKFDSLFSTSSRSSNTTETETETPLEKKDKPFSLPYKVNFVKVNVNGFEKQVFQGMETMLKHDSPTLMFCSMAIDTDVEPSVGGLQEQKNVIHLFQEELKVLRKDLFTYLESLDYKIMKISGAQNHFIAKKI